MDNKNPFLLQKKTLKEIVEKKAPANVQDPCPVCGSELYFDETTTRRCAIMDSDNNIEGWLCPDCMSEFTEKGELVDIFTTEFIRGKT